MCQDSRFMKQRAVPSFVSLNDPDPGEEILYLKCTFCVPFYHLKVLEYYLKCTTQVHLKCKEYAKLAQLFTNRSTPVKIIQNTLPVQLYHQCIGNIHFNWADSAGKQVFF